MNVAIDMVFRFYPLLYRMEKLYTASPDPGTAEVPKSQGWCVCDQDVCFCGDVVPSFQAGGSSRKVEGPPTKLRLPWGSFKQHFIIIKIGKSYMNKEFGRSFNPCSFNCTKVYQCMPEQTTLVEYYSLFSNR